ncbi:BA75_00706T0 [Komagataella pastoris]|uniref:Prefoldin subunit 3 n=1 Tax=Komagataella pastoris TaxID=4922 RepID=A0A1B2J7W5_PICPA|nr:BA75_00706T0 [Komagataella pastoris]
MRFETLVFSFRSALLTIFPFYRTEQTNPRGIPQAKFIDRVESLLNPSTCTNEDVDHLLKECQTRLQQYKFMEENKRLALNGNKSKIPNITKTLEMVQYLKERKGEDDDEPLQTNYELNETLYSKAEIDVQNLNNVYLWLGADVMMEYPLDEAIELLTTRLALAKEAVKIAEEDLEFLREQITTMEVNTARVYNWDITRRKGLAPK